MPHSNLDPTFARTYSAIVEHVKQRYRELGVDHSVPVFDPPDVAQWSVLGVPRDRLVAVAGDEQFVQACYTRLVNRLGAPREVRAAAARLAADSITRDELIDEFMSSEEYARLATTVTLT